MSAPAHSERVLSFDEASRVVSQRASAIDRNTVQAEEVALQQCAGRVLAQAIRADRDLPPFPRAMRDGFAVRAADVATAGEHAPCTLRIVGEIAAGDPSLPTIRAGEAAAIMTGAPIPGGADAVVMIEQTRSAEANRVEILRAVKTGDNIAPRASEAPAGAVLLTPGIYLDAAAIAVAATTGTGKLQVFRRPQVAILATGSELVEVGALPTRHQIRNSNGHALAAQSQAAGADAVM